jgi:hypothetical protein
MADFRGSQLVHNFTQNYLENNLPKSPNPLLKSENLEFERSNLGSFSPLHNFKYNYLVYRVIIL